MDFLGFDAIRAELKEAEAPAMPELVILRFDAADGGRIVIVEDDGRTAYAYLLARGVVVSSVWLYNVAEAPVLADWSLEAKFPFEPARLLQSCGLRSHPKHVTGRVHVVCVRR
jgi:hypothetical protein